MPNKKLKLISLSKKSQFEDLLPLLVTIIFLGVFYLLFLFTNLNGTIEARGKLKLNVIGEDSSQLLLNFLTSPFPLGNLPGSSMADAITTYILTEDENLLKQIDAKANEYFSKSILETDSSSWSMTIKSPEKGDIIVESEKSLNNYITRHMVSKIMMPSPNPDKPVEVELFFVVTKWVAEE